ncbi:MAG: hypothetical protein AAFV19_20985 [Pseudomonadota bacterium]
MALALAVSACAAPTVQEEIRDLNESFQINEVEDGVFVARGDRLSWGSSPVRGRQVADSFVRRIGSELKARGHRFLKFEGLLQKTSRGRFVSSTGRELIAVARVADEADPENGFASVDAPLEALSLYAEERQKLPYLEGRRRDTQFAKKWKLCPRGCN